MATTIPHTHRARRLDDIGHSALGAAGDEPQRQRGAGTHLLGFALFILVTAVLFIRPAEIVPGLDGLSFYEPLIIICFLASFPAVVEQLRTLSLAARPVTVCVLGLIPAVMISYLSEFSIYDARTSGWDFAKVVLYYLLLVGVVNSPGRLRQFLVWLVGMTLVLTTLSLLQYHGKINLPALRAIEQLEIDEETGDEYFIYRLCSTGIFQDPNDLSLILVMAMTICLYRLGEGHFWLLRGLWLAPLALFGYALSLTHSRGGFIMLLAAIVALVWSRFGWRKAIPLAAILVPTMFMIFEGRMTGLSTSDGTGQERIQLWSEGFEFFKEAPWFGIGKDNFNELINQPAHNSFVHCYAELGFFGGTLFFGTFLFAFWSLRRLAASKEQIKEQMRDPELLRLRPYLLAIVCGYGAGMLTLSRAYIVPTYMILGMATALVRLAALRPSAPVLLFNSGLAVRLTLASLAFLTLTYVYVRVSVRWG